MYCDKLTYLNLNLPLSDGILDTILLCSELTTLILLHSPSKCYGLENNDRPLNLNKLKRLEIYFPAIDARLLINLLSSNPNLEHLTLESVNDEWFPKILINCSNLTSLTLTGFKPLSAKSIGLVIHYLKKLTHLSLLFFFAINITTCLCDNLLSNLPNLKKFSVIYLRLKAAKVSFYFKFFSFLISDSILLQRKKMQDRYPNVCITYVE